MAKIKYGFVPVVGMEVEMLPNHGFSHQANGTYGRIMHVSSDYWDDPLWLPIIIKWDNGHENSYNLSHFVPLNLDNEGAMYRLLPLEELV